MGAPMSAGVIRNVLAAVPLFSILDDAELDALAAASRSMSYRKGARIFEEGSPAECCLVLTAGRANVVLNAGNGAEVLLGVVVPGHLVGEVALLDASTRSASLVAAEQCTFIRVPASSFDALRRNRAFEDRLVSRLAATLRGANDQVRGISTLPSVARVAWCLGRIARQEGVRDGRIVVIPKKAHQELAEMTGCSRETVTRALGTLRGKKYILSDNTTMRLDLEGLQRYFRMDL